MDTDGALLEPEQEPEWLRQPSLLQLAHEQEYARAAVTFRETKQAYERARRELMVIVDKIGHDRDHLLADMISEKASRKGASAITYRVPLPATMPQIRAHMGWSTQRTNDWLKYHQKKGHVFRRGPRRRYVYYYTEEYLNEIKHEYARPDKRSGS